MLYDILPLVARNPDFSHKARMNQNPKEPTGATAGISFQTIWALTWPQLLMSLFQFMVGFVDIYVAGLLHSDIQAAIGLVNQYLIFFLVVAFAMGNAAIAAIGQSLGAGLRIRAARYAGLVMGFSLLFSLLLVLLGTIFRDQALAVIQVPEAILPLTRYLWNVLILTIPANYMIGLSGSIFRAHKLVRLPLMAMILVCVVNLVGDFGLAFGKWGLPEMGYSGLVWATFSSTLAGAVFLVAMLIRCGILTRDSLVKWRWIKRGAPYLIKVAVPSMGSSILWNLGYLTLFGVVATLPRDSVYALAGMTAGMRIEAILFLPGVAFSMTASILVGNLLGAGNPKEAARVGQKLLLMGAVMMSCVAACLWFFIDPMASLLAPDPLVRAHTINYLKINLLATPFTLASMILNGILGGAGATLFTLFANSTAIWCVRLPLAYYLGHVIFASSFGVFLSMLCSLIYQSSVLFYIFKTRNWPRFAMIRRSTKS